MRRALIACLACSLVILIGRPIEARLQYQRVIENLEDPTQAEKELQDKLLKLEKNDRCNVCHAGKSRKEYSAYGEHLYDILAGGNRENFEYDRRLWKKEDGEYKAEAIKQVRDAVNEAAKADKESEG